MIYGQNAFDVAKLAAIVIVCVVNYVSDICTQRERGRLKLWFDAIKTYL